jgi:hypothetical protein
MKKPRIDDFDPSATKLSSPLDTMPEIQPAIRRVSSPAQQGQVATMERPDMSSADLPERTPVRPYARAGKNRSITRYAFEFYQDQIEQLRRISLEAKLEGEKGSMSEMVREAIDDYIAKRTGGGEE